MRHSPGGRHARYHAFLRRLRAKGRSNMYGAIPYLMDAFGLDRESAFRIVCEWVDAEPGTASGAPGSGVPGRLLQRTPRTGGARSK